MKTNSLVKNTSVEDVRWPQRPPSTSARRQMNHAGRPTLDELARRKIKVMEVATALFAEHGYAGTSLIDIAKSAGVATRTLYQHFGDKEALFRGVISARDVSFIIVPPEVKPGDTMFETLIAAAHYACDAAFRDRVVGLMRLMIAESTRFPEFMDKVSNATFSRFKRNIAGIFSTLAAQHLIPDGDHQQSAALFIDLVLGTAPIMFYTGWLPNPPTSEDIEVKVDLFIRGRFGTAISRTSRTKKSRNNR